MIELTCFDTNIQIISLVNLISKWKKRTMQTMTNGDHFDEVMIMNLTVHQKIVMTISNVWRKKIIRHYHHRMDMKHRMKIIL